jgi:DNA-binding XRE family transcriptional regulator
MSIKPMTSDEYRSVREKIGSQDYVAERLGLNKMTISNRERGKYPVSLEAQLALIHLYDFSPSSSQKILEIIKSEDNSSGDSSS